MALQLYSKCAEIKADFHKESKINAIRKIYKTISASSKTLLDRLGLYRFNVPSKDKFMKHIIRNIAALLAITAAALAYADADKVMRDTIPVWPECLAPTPTKSQTRTEKSRK